MPDIARHAELSQKLDYTDLDWDHAVRVGLSDREKRILPYFADVEGQTLFYMVEALKLKPARTPENMGFIAIWSYEEFFHSRAIGKLLEACDCTSDPGRIAQVRRNVTFRNKLEDMIQVVLSRLFPRAFVALWMMWGASQEALTLRGYQALAESTPNPVLRELCLRIAKQERRHFAYYYSAARERLGQSRFSQRFTRFIFERLWTPVGAGVKTKEEVARVIGELFPGEALPRVFGATDARLAKLPGMEGFKVMSRYADSIQELLPPECRYVPATSDPASESA